jgi:hypothetical protein
VRGEVGGGEGEGRVNRDEFIKRLMKVFGAGRRGIPKPTKTQQPPGRPKVPHSPSEAGKAEYQAIPGKPGGVGVPRPGRKKGLRKQSHTRGPEAPAPEVARTYQQRLQDLLERIKGGKVSVDQAKREYEKLFAEMHQERTLRGDTVGGKDSLLDWLIEREEHGEG